MVLTRFHMIKKGKLHLNDKSISSFVRYFLMSLRLYDVEIKHTLFDVSSSSLNGSLSLSKTDNGLLRIKQQKIEHDKNTLICHFKINSFTNSTR